MSNKVRLVAVVECDRCGITKFGSADFACPGSSSVRLPDEWRWAGGWGEDQEPICDACVRKDEEECARREAAELERRRKQTERNARARQRRTQRVAGGEG